MSRTGRRSLIAAFALLTVVGLMVQAHRAEDLQRRVAPTTFGQLPAGYGALFDLLSELGWPVDRSYDPPEALAVDATVWWIEPSNVCAVTEMVGPPARHDLLDNTDWQGGAWVEMGGTAVVFLPPPRCGSDPCASIAGIALPPRRAGSPDACTTETHTAHERSQDDATGLELPKPRHQRVKGSFLKRSRHIAAPLLTTFTDAGTWTVSATADKRPFVIERTLGKGRIVVVADATFLRNAWLDHADAAPLAVDFVHAFGVPRFDEREHGLRVERSGAAYLLASPALPVFVGLALFGILFAWHGSALPPPVRRAEHMPAPTLTAFIDSLAALYAGTGDYERALQRYRELTAARLRRHFGLPSETPLPVLAERLRAFQRLAPAAVTLLADGVPVDSEAALRDTVRALDMLVQEVAG